jgi:glycosyltransferase involved in cell wall biosynthesis
MTRKEACIVVTYFVDRQPGFLDFLYRIRALSRRYDVMLVSRAPLDQPEWDGIEAQRVVLPRSESRPDWVRYLLDCAALIRRHPGRRVILLASTLAPVALLLRGRPVALYWNEHPTHFSPDPAAGGVLKSALRRLVRAAMFGGARRAGVVMPIGEAHRDDLLANGVAAQRMRMIYMGVHAGFAAEAGAGRESGSKAGHDAVRLIYVGTISRERGRDVMLEGLALAARAGVPAHLTLVGADDEQIAYCAKQAARLGIGAQLTITGRVPGTEIPRWLRASDAGVCLWEDRPWWRFNPPTKLFEYLVAGLPVLASDIRTHTAYLRDGRDGFVFDYGAAGFAAAVGRLHARRAELPALSAHAAEAGSQFVWDRLEPNFLATVERLGSPA